MNSKSLFLEFWKTELSATVHAIESVPESQWSWRPHEKNRSAHELTDHIVSHAEDICACLEDGVTHHRMETRYHSVAGAIQALEHCNSRLLQLLSVTSDEEWAGRAVKMLVMNRQVGGGPAGEMCWKFLLGIIHHRGQLSVYYRPMGVVNPVIYGPTAETTETLLAQLKPVSMQESGFNIQHSGFRAFTQ